MPLDQFDIDKDELPAEYRDKLPEAVRNALPQSEMTFIEHLDVLRKHLFRSAIVTLIITCIVAFTISFIYNDIILAPTKNDFITYRIFCELATYLDSPMLCMEVKEVQFFNRDMAGQFTMHVTSSFTLGIIISFPFLIYQVWKFIKPGLKKTEANATAGIVFFCSILFFLGVAFGYYLVLPLSHQFFASYSITDNVTVVNQFDLSSYISVFVDIILACGIMFQLPMLVYILSKLGIITPAFMITYRKHAIVVIMVLSAVLTPPDVFSMVLLSIPLVGLYEVSIFISKVIEKKELKKHKQS